MRETSAGKDAAMHTELNEHAGEEILERYAMSTLPDVEVEPFEEHLLICPVCQRRLEEMDAYVLAAGTAAAKLRQESPSAWRNFAARLTLRRLPAPLWVAGAVVVLVSGIWFTGRWELSQSPVSSPAVVLLRSGRGAHDTARSRAPSRQPLLLQVDLKELPTLPVYGLEIVDARGSRLWQSQVEPQDGRLSIRVTRKLAAGRYWVRLFKVTPPKELLREYGLAVK